MIEAFRNTDAGHKVEVVTEMAVIMSRGILDVARERNTDVILHGVQRSAQGSVKLGTVVENVIATAAPVMAAIRADFREVFPSAKFADVWIEEDEGIVLRAILQDFQAPTRDKLYEARGRVSQHVIDEARLEVIYRQKLAVGVPRATAEAG